MRRFFSFGIGDFAIHLRQRLKSAHRQQRVADRHQDDDERDLCKVSPAQPAQRFVGQMQVRRRRQRRQFGAAAQDQRERRPHQYDHHHHRGDLHNAQSFVAGFRNAFDVAVPEVDGDGHAEEHRKRIRIGAPALMQRLRHIVEQAPQVLARAHRADGAGENIIHHQRGNRKLRHRGSDAVLDHDVDAAAHEHAAAFHVDRAHRVAEQHHAQHHPGRRFADGLLGDAADVKHRRGQIVEHHRGRLPEGDEGQGDRGRHHHFGGGR